VIYYKTWWRRQRRDSGTWRIDLQVSRRLSHRPVAF